MSSSDRTLPSRPMTGPPIGVGNANGSSCAELADKDEEPARSEDPVGS